MIAFLIVLLVVFGLLLLHYFLAFKQAKGSLAYEESISSEQRRQLGALHDVLIDLPTDATTPYSERVKMLLADLANNKLELRQIDWHLNISALIKPETRIKKIQLLIKLNQEAATKGFIPNKDADYR